jgi:Xaa-Pro aminopeptidase
MIDAEKLRRVHHLLEERQLDALLLTNPFSIAWLSDYEMPIQSGPSPFDAGSLLLVERAGMTLLIADVEAETASVSGLAVRPYRSYTVDEPLNPVAHLAAELEALMRRQGRVGVEWNSLTAPLAAALQRGVQAQSIQAPTVPAPATHIRPEREPVGVDGSLDRLRAEKTTAEVERLRRSLALCDLAQATLRQVIVAGASELELWAEVVAAMETAAGQRLPLLADFVGGRRTAEIGGPPTGKRIAAGEWILADIVPRFGNYWGDNCNVAAAGPPTPVLERLHHVAAGALELTKTLIRPGAVPAGIDAAARAFIGKNGYEAYPHHTGHGLGVSYHEGPRLVPYNREPLREGMVIAVEPGVYVSEVGGVRLEDVVLVTPGGCEVLTRHEKELPGGG